MGTTDDRPQIHPQGDAQPGAQENGEDVPVTDTPTPPLGGEHWVETYKGDARAREHADRHYTRQSPGHPMWTRPGYNCVMLTHDASALWCWWRPKWEHGTPGTSRKDGLRVIECTMFRRDPGAPIASFLVCAAVDYLRSEHAARSLHLDAAGVVNALITGVGSSQTRGGRSPRSPPGACFRHAGWRQFSKRGGKADVWLCAPAPWATWEDVDLPMTGPYRPEAEAIAACDDDGGDQ
jgi:hypothetical protein